MKKILQIICIFCLTDLMAQPLSGNYTIDPLLGASPTNFTTFSDAITALNVNGVDPLTGAVFLVQSGQVFNEQPPVLYASGTAAGPIVFMRDGILANPVIIPSAPGTVALSGVISGFGTHGDGVIRISGSDYVTFDGIDIDTNSAHTSSAAIYEYGYVLYKRSATDGCQHVTIRNATVRIKSAVVNACGIYLSSYDSAGVAVVTSSEAGRAQDIIIRKNTIINAYNGIQLRGYLHASSPYNFFDHFVIADSNTIQSFAGAGVECYGVYTTNQDSIQVNDNNISSRLTSSAVYGIRPAAAINATMFILRNTISIKQGGGSSSFYGIDNAAGGTGAGNFIDISFNIIENCTTTNTGSPYLIRGNANPTLMHISNNEIRNIYNSAATANVMYGIYSIPGAGTTSKVFKNHLHHIEQTQPGNTGILYIHICNSTLETHVYQNHIHDIVHRGVGNVQIIARSNTINFYHYNNLIYRLYAPNSTHTDAIRAIELNTGSSNMKVFFNTVYLDSGSTSATTFGTTCLHIVSTVGAEVRNNILVNNSIPGPTAGYVSAYKRSTTALANYDVKSNNNCFYVDTTQTRRVIFTDGTNFDNSISAYRTRVGPNRDSVSFSEFPPFVNVLSVPYDLRLSSLSSLCTAGGSAVNSPLSITTDHFGFARNTTPDVGAYEVSSALPVDFLYFNAEAASEDVVLNWATASEINSYGFELERSVDGQQFEFVSFHKGQGNSSHTNRYMTIDEKALSANPALYYRLKQVDLDGSFTYSDLVFVSRTTSKQLLTATCYPNPFNGSTTVLLENAAPGQVFVEITDHTGKLIQTRSYTAIQGENKFTLEGLRGLNAGVYMIRINGSNTLPTTLKLIKTEN